MANTIDWGKVYCTTWWGDSSNVVTIDIDSQPICFAGYIITL